jgi:hypothetical protein
MFPFRRRLRLRLFVAARNSTTRIGGGGGTQSRQSGGVRQIAATMSCAIVTAMRAS